MRKYSLIPLKSLTLNDQRFAWKMRALRAEDKFKKLQEGMQRYFNNQANLEEIYPLVKIKWDNKFVKHTMTIVNGLDEIKKVEAVCKKHGEVDADYESYEEVVGDNLRDSAKER